MSNLVSIIIPCYNQANFLDETLQSVTNQVFKNWECIIINDGSTDNTEDIAKIWTQKDTRFKYLFKENGGLSNARNYGIKHSNGKYILPLDADDKISEDYLKLALEIFEKDKSVGIVYGRVKNFGTKENEWILPNYSFEKLLLNNMIFCSAVYKKVLWSTAGGYDESFKTGWEDWEFWINALSKTQAKVYKINSICFYYRRKEESMLKGLNYDLTEQKNIKTKVYLKHISIYSQYFPVAIDSFSINEQYKSKISKLKNNFLYKLYRFFKKK